MAPIKAREAVPTAEVQYMEAEGKIPCPACVPAKLPRGQYSDSAWAHIPTGQLGTVALLMGESRPPPLGMGGGQRPHVE